MENYLKNLLEKCFVYRDVESNKILAVIRQLIRLKSIKVEEDKYTLKVTMWQRLEVRKECYDTRLLCMSDRHAGCLGNIKKRFSCESLETEIEKINKESEVNKLKNNLLKLSRFGKEEMEFDLSVVKL